MSPRDLTSGCGTALCSSEMHQEIAAAPLSSARFSYLSSAPPAAISSILQAPSEATRYRCLLRRTPLGQHQLAPLPLSGSVPRAHPIEPHEQGVRRTPASRPL